MKTSTALATILALSLTAAPAYAQIKERTFKIVNCSTLKGKSPICFVNDTDEQVTNIGCEVKGGFFSKGGEFAVAMPPGGIQPHSLTVVDFGTKSCDTTLILTVGGGGERRIPNVHTDQMTIIEIPKQ